MKANKDSGEWTQKFIGFAALVFSLIGFLVMVFFFIIIYNNFEISCSEITKEEMATTGQIGDYIGGIVGTLWSFVGVLLIFLTFLSQRKETSNINKRWAQERVESHYFKLIEDLQKIEFRDNQESRIMQFSKVRNQLSRLSNSKKIDYFNNPTSRATPKLCQLLLFIMNYLFEKNKEGVKVEELLKHFAITTTRDEKIILLYYYHSFPEQFEIIKDFYFLSDMFPKDYKSENE